MNLIEAYEKHGNAPSRLTYPHERWLVFRANELLSGTAQEEVVRLLTAVDHLFNYWFYFDSGEDESEEGDEWRSGRTRDFEYTNTLIGQLFYSRDDKLTQRLVRLDGSDWVTVFAALSIGFYALHLEDVDRSVDASRRDLAGSILLTAAANVAAAVEALGYAERLAMQEADIAKRVKSERAAVARKAAAKRHARTDAMKAQYVQFYAANSHLSKAQAAREFVAMQGTDQMRFVSKENIVRTLVQALKMP